MFLSRIVSLLRITGLLNHQFSKLISTWIPDHLLNMSFESNFFFLKSFKDSIFKDLSYEQISSSLKYLWEASILRQAMSRTYISWILCCSLYRSICLKTSLKLKAYFTWIFPTGKNTVFYHLWSGWFLSLLNSLRENAKGRLQYPRIKTFHWKF